MTIFTSLVLVGSTLLTAPHMFGNVYTQPAVFPSGRACQCWTSQYGSDNGAGYKTFDNFTLSSSALIHSVNWQGLYWNFGHTDRSYLLASTNSWDIQFWSNNSGTPGALLLTQNLPAASVSTSLAGVTSALGSPTNVYSFDATLPSGFFASAGATYFLSVLSQQSVSDPLFAWAAGSGGNGGSEQELLGSYGSGFFSRAEDRAFSLSATTPEPALFGLLGASLSCLLFAALLRKRV